MIRGITWVAMGLLLLVSAGFLLTAAEPVPIPAKPDSITVKPVDLAEFEAEVAKHKGKIVLVDCWATWCLPCVKDFPKTLELGKTHASDGLVIISLSFDDLDKGQPPAKVLKYLDSKQARIVNLISKLDLAKKGADVFDIDDGALPHYKLYGRDGKLLRKIASSETETVTHEDVIKAVKQAVNGK